MGIGLSVYFCRKVLSAQCSVLSKIFGGGGGDDGDVDGQSDGWVTGNWKEFGGRESSGRSGRAGGYLSADRCGGPGGIWPLTELVAVLSVNLAVFNVLPIPALDGGRMFLSGWNG